MDACTDAQTLIVKQIQRDRLAEAETMRLTRGAPHPVVPNAGQRGTDGWPRRVIERFRPLAWG